MKTANYKNNLIKLDSLSREEYQKIHEEGKRGALTCPVCNERVRLYLGLERDPYFFHVLAKDKVCSELQTEKAAIKVEPKEEYIERNGFKIPISRSISTTTATKEIVLKKPQPLKFAVPYKPSTPTKIKNDGSYLSVLSQNGFSLDKSQAEAVLHTEGPLLVLAGAGSGKTRVLTTRTAYMLEEKNIDPKSIMLVTFTAKAAAEMKSRLNQYPGMNPKRVQQLVSGTFHSLFYRIVSFYDQEKWNSSNLLKKDWQREQLLKEAGKNLKLDEKEFSYDLALQQISYWKNNLQYPHCVKPVGDWEEKVSILYKDYEQKKQTHHYFDFDDMLIGCYQLLQNDSQLLESYQNRFQYFLIDEFQDINKVQYELIKLLSSKSKQVCAVGDDDQSIYAFRGSDPSYLLEFEQDFPKAKLVVLDQNYRSSHEIVTVANKIIHQNKRRRIKVMNAQHSKPKLPLCFFPYDEEEEATMILTDIQEKIASGNKPSDFAILFRTNTGSRAVFERLVHSSLPFKIDLDVESFYERFIVKGMLAFLSLAVNEDDQNAIKAILPVLFIKQAVLQDLKATSILQDSTMLEALSRLDTGFAFQKKKLQKLVPIIRSLAALSPVLAIEKVEKDLGFGDFVKKRGNEGNQLEKGSDDIRDLKVAARGFNTLKDFLEHTDHMKAMNKEMKQQSKQLDDAVTLSTIHRAKGLEYPTVYVLGAVEGNIPHDYALETLRSGDDSALEEERRLLYVAVTRAKDSLYLSVPSRNRGKKAKQTRFLSSLL
jgi:DNA helicase II / ATP-dependent DNA helicase PcrA